MSAAKYQNMCEVGKRKKESTLIHGNLDVSKDDLQDMKNIKLSSGTAQKTQVENTLFDSFVE